MHFKTVIVVHNSYLYCLYSEPANCFNFRSRVLKNVIQNFLIYMLDNNDCNFMLDDQFYVVVCFVFVFLFVCLFVCCCFFFFGGGLDLGSGCFGS